MSEAHRAAARLQEIAARLGRSLGLPAMSACEEMAYKRQLSDPPMAPPDGKSLDAMKMDMLLAWRRDGASALDPARARTLPSILWHRDGSDTGDTRNLELSAQMPEIWGVFLQLAAKQPRLLLTAIDGWLRDFDPATAGFKAAGVDIAAHLARATHPRLLPWLAAHRRFDLFHADASPARIAEALLGLSASVETTLQTACLDNPLRQQGLFFRSCLVRLLALTPNALAQPTARQAFDRVHSLIEVDRPVSHRLGRQGIDRGPRFENLEKYMAEGCLNAWLEGRAHANAPKPAVQSFLLSMIGDPRLQKHRWEKVNERARGLMRRWVSEQNLEAFLSLIRKAGDTRQWRYREAFWRACFRKVETAEVWVILGRDLAAKARQVGDLAGDFGTMDSASQAVLLMQMGNVMFSEWSNVGALRAWDMADPRCPRSYAKTVYSQLKLKASCLPFPDEHGYLSHAARDQSDGLAHHSPERGLWQARAAHLLRQKIGVTLTRADYMPQ